MKLYEIVKTESVWIDRGYGYYNDKISVITATMDKNVAEKMLEIYRHNQRDNESYQIRELKIPEIHEW